MTGKKKFYKPSFVSGLLYPKIHPFCHIQGQNGKVNTLLLFSLKCVGSSHLREPRPLMFRSQITFRFVYGSRCRSLYLKYYGLGLKIILILIEQKQIKVAVAVDFKDQIGEQQTMQQNLQNISLKTGAPMESHAAAVLTPFAFSKLQEQLVLAAHYASFQLEDCFLVRHHTKSDGGRNVYWAPLEGIIGCSCQLYEFSGILCRHALRVLSAGNCFQIPDRYLPLRWRRISSSAQMVNQNDHAERVQSLHCLVSNLVSESVKSRERLDFATEKVSVLLSRIREQPPVYSTSSSSYTKRNG
ncbi:hypothetical protein DM860_003640 [Cuscuta australis]|uniref:Protein FAR1-RELATED SEQUENCE n=1 Tax=Cuscuta australis TaxID=267555 RepID=A0A328DL43_9ASTE|nr:hypothetical protein DM860_003640 [Cuscuta australis]